MAKYLIEAAYAHEGLKGLIKEGGTGRRAAVDAAAKALGARVEAMYWGFGTDDVYAIVDSPDNVSAAAFALAIGATGTHAHYRTIVLPTAQEVVQAPTKSSWHGYRAPGH